MRLFQIFPSIFFELINQPTSKIVDYQFSSVEIKQLAFRIDGVFLPLNRNSEEPKFFSICPEMRLTMIGKEIGDWRF